MTKLKRTGDALYLGGAAASLVAAAPVVHKYWDAFKSAPWQELTSYVQVPWEAIGVGELGQVISGYRDDNAQNRSAHLLEHVGRVMRTANILAIPLAYFTDNNVAYSIGLTGASTVLGHGIEAAGKMLRERKKTK